MKNISPKVADRLRLKQFLENNIPVAELMEVGFIPKGTKKTDYEKIAARVCEFFGYKSIYEYKKVCHGKLCDGKNCDRSNKFCEKYDADNPEYWKKLKVDELDMITKESWLN